MEKDAPKARILGELLAQSKGDNKPLTLSLAFGAGKEPVESILKRLGVSKNATSIDIVDVHPLARVASVRGRPSALAPVVAAAEVEDALRSDQPDLLPKPINRRIVDLSKGEGFETPPSPSRVPTSTRPRTKGRSLK